MLEGKDDGVQSITHPDLPKAHVLTIFPEGKGSEEIVEKMTKAGIVDITDGFPAQNEQQVWEIIWNLFFEKGISRIPIIGVEETAAEKTYVKVYMFCQPGRKMQHRTLWEELGRPEDVIFTTSIENFSIDHVPVELPYLELPDITVVKDKRSRHRLYLRLGSGSDVSAFYKDHPLSKGFTQTGRETVKNIFNIGGIKTYGL